MSEIMFTEFDDARVREFLKDMEARLKDVKGSRQKYVSMLSMSVFADIMDHFKKEQGPNRKWKAWGKVYAEHQAKRGRTLILQDSGVMRDSFTPKNTRKTSQGIMWFNNAKTEKGFPYAFAHDNDGPRSTLPQRKFMWLSDKAVGEIASKTLNFILMERV